MKMNIRKGVLACMLTAGLISSGTYMPAASEKRTAEPATDSTASVSFDERVDSSETGNDDFYYFNEDPADVRNAKITEEEAQAAREERLIPEDELGYEYGTVLVNYERGEVQAAAERLGLDSEWDLYKKHLREQGDVSISEISKYDDWIILSIQLNEHKAVQTAIQKYEQLEGVNYAQPNYYIYYPDPIIPSDKHWFLINDDEESIKNANISQEEAQAAQNEHAASPSALGYYPGVISVTFDRAKAAAEAEQQGLPGELELYKKLLKDQGDCYFSDKERDDKILTAYIYLNKRKTVHTAIQQYEALNYVNHAQPLEVQVSVPFRVDGIYSICQDNFISLGCVHENAGENTKFRWEYCVIGENEWHLIEDWNSSEWCSWFPDANENYAVVCKTSYTGSGSADQQIVWYASRPQMAKQITGRCAMPTEDGILIGCTSNINAADTDYRTACYIWSCDRQTWIDVAAYRASNCAWYRSSTLPKGNYIIYNCTEIDIPGTKNHRKLSCDYYLMNVH